MRKLIFILLFLMIFAGCKNVDKGEEEVLIQDGESKIINEKEIKNESGNDEIEKAKLKQEVELNGVKYKVYEDRISFVEGDSEEVLVEFDSEKHEFIYDNPDLRISPDGDILFFNYFQGESSYRLNGVDLKNKQLIWENSEIGGGADIFWSLKNMKVVFVWNFYDNLSIVAVNKNNLKEIQFLVEKVYYPSNVGDDLGNQKYYWESEEVFVFEPDVEFYKIVKEHFDEKGLKKGKNEFIVN